MICVNDLTELKCHKKEILKPLVICLSPFAPHLAEELWAAMGGEALSVQQFPEADESYLVESSFAYPVAFNGKMRFKAELGLDLDKKQVEDAVLAMEQTNKYLQEKSPKKVIVVPGKIVNIVV
jgi:leucyl-tRNA synthetase